MKIKIKDIDSDITIEKETDGLPWIDCEDFKTETCIFFPQEIAIEVGCNFSSEKGGEIWNIDDIRHDVECYFTNYIECIIDKTIEYINDYGDEVQ